MRVGIAFFASSGDGGGPRRGGGAAGRAPHGRTAPGTG